MPLPLAGEEAKAGQSPKSKPQEKIWLTPERKEYMRKWHQAHPGKNREYCRAEYRRNHARYRSKRGTEEFKAELRSYVRNHRAKYPERHKASLKRYRAAHPEYFEAYKKTYAPRRRELYHQNKKKHYLTYRLKSMLRYAFKCQSMKKQNRTETLIGCTVAEVRKHIESQFVNGMSWDKPDSFEVDHYVPISAFNLHDPEEAHWAFNWHNLRPITAHDNAVKSDTLPSPLPDWLPLHIAARITERMEGE